MGENETKPGQLASSPVMQLIGAGRKLQQRLEGELAELGLTMRHLGALGHLSRRPDLSYSDLARRSGITTPSMLATVRALENLGAVSRADAGKGHPARLEITETGRELLGQVRAVVARLDAELTGDLPDDQRETLQSTLLTLMRPGP
ncbi:MarR family winged helix-turn-helix transcriptional regulator [Spirillospora sp. CA-294931]|uniref:MarR family winged helix-turn-helix transcriptional regulator n=1 Tax=Spirillospora sp. CA-294931 TaxID=3240042 RepID=UPI003D92D320